MFRYGKLSRQAVAAISFLATRHGPGRPLVSSREVGDARGMSGALAAKLLSAMSAAGLVEGVPGPRGGYRLARPPQAIRLAEVVALFENGGGEAPCPFGPGYCGSSAPCPLHDDFMRIDRDVRAFLDSTTLAAFAAAVASPPAAAPPAAARRKKTRPPDPPCSGNF
jgi:Rrf2 family transcriptional regulator, iron-sulfur cluster assembly transcription factor